MMDIDTEEGMAQAMQWMTRLLDTCAEQFVWGVPRSLAVYEIDQKGKLVICPKYSAGRDASVEQVFKHLGYTVLVEIDSTTNTRQV